MSESKNTDLELEEGQNNKFERAKEILKHIIEETNKDGEADNETLANECFNYLQEFNLLTPTTIKQLLSKDEGPNKTAIGGTLLKKKKTDPMPKDSSDHPRYYVNAIQEEGDYNYHLCKEWNANKLFKFLKWVCERGGMEKENLKELEDRFESFKMSYKSREQPIKDEKAKKGLDDKQKEAAIEAKIDSTHISRVLPGVNLIIYGAPGTGKSHWVEHYNELKETEKREDVKIDKDKDKIVRVVFHPEYTYFDFIGQYRPCPLYKPLPGNQKLLDAGGNQAEIPGEPFIDYQFVPGPFTEVLVEAYNDPDSMYTLLIEELNRADAAAVFGDVFQLLDRNIKGESEYGIRPSQEWIDFLKKQENDNGITILSDDGKLKIPSNMNIIATMNSADQGVHVLDTAFKRRWKYKFMSIEEGLDNSFEKVPYAKEKREWKDFLTKINQALQNKFDIKEDRLIGPYFASQDAEGIKKILFYLWDDVLRNQNRNEFFGVNSMYELYNKYNDGKGTEDFMHLFDKVTPNNDQGNNTENTEASQGDGAE